MKQISNQFIRQVTLLAFLLTGVVHGVWGASTTYTMTIDSNSSAGNNNVHWSKSGITSLTWEGITWNVGFTGTNASITTKADYAQIGSSKNPATKITLSTTGFAGKVIRKVALSGYCMSNTGPTLTIKAGTTNILTNKPLSEQTSGTTGTNIATYTSKNTESVLLGANDAITFTINSSAKAGINIYAVSVEYEESAVTLNSFGYATFASTSAIDLSMATDYSAWQITGVSGTAIAFAPVAGSVAAGTGLLLKGEPGATINLTYVSSGEAIEGNQLVGITSATAVEDNKYYGLSDNQFKKVSAGTVPAGKALLPASVVAGSEIKAFSFVFDDQPTGLKVINENARQHAIYTLSGQRVRKATKGIYIIDGKKVMK